MNPKDFIEQAKDYADIADASYAMLHYVYESIDSIFKSMECV